MNNRISTSITRTVYVLLLSVIGIALPSQAIDIYISPTGSDLSSGTEASPFATPQAARDAIRVLKAGGSFKGPVNVIFRQGTYYLSETLVLEPVDSGSAGAPVTWRAATGEKVVLSGGRLITGTWTDIDGKIWRVDLPAAKGWVRNPAVAEVYEQKPAGPWHFRQLFVDTNRAIRARFPNKSVANPYLYATGGSTDYLTLSSGQAKASWNGEPDAQINIVVNWRFFNQWNDIVSVDAPAGILRFGPRERNTDVISGNWFWIEGVKSELDEPQEWYLDPAAGQLYYIPATGKNPNNLQITAPFLNRIIYLKGDVNAGTHVKNVWFKDLEFRHTKFTLGHIEPRVCTDAAVLFENAESCGIDNCYFANIGGYALWLHLDCKDIRFNGNTVTDAGGGGVLMTGSRLSYMDDTKIYTPGEAASRVAPYLNHVTNNYVHHCGKIRYYGGGVHLDSRPANMTMMQGNLIAHNHFSDLSRNGVFAFRNQGGNIVEFNRIHNAMQTTIDGAAIHFATMTHENAPNYIMNNYLYDVWGYEQMSSGIPARSLANGIYLDWATSNTTMKNNYIYNTVGGSIKKFMTNQNIVEAFNQSSASPITPPFVNQVGPEGDSTIGVNLNDNWFKNSSVIHFSDSAQVKYSGSWVERIYTGFYGLFKYGVLEAPPTSAATISYSILIPESGTYALSVLYPPSASYASNTVLLVKNNDSTIDRRSWDQKTGDDKGFSVPIGEYFFQKGSTAKIAISNEGANGVVVANAIAYVFTNNGIILDNSASAGVTVTGSWVSSAATPGFFGADYLHDNNTEKGMKTVRYTPDITTPGTYTISLRWTEGANRASSVPVVVACNGVTKTVSVNMQTNGGLWNSLGTFTLSAGKTNYVEIQTSGTNGFVVADAVSFIPKSDVQAIRNPVQRAVPLLSLYPNPFRRTLSVTLTGIEPFSAKGIAVSIYNCKGKLVRMVSTKVQPGKSVLITWDGTDWTGNPVGAGTYIIQAKREGHVCLRKATLVR